MTTAAERLETAIQSSGKSRKAKRRSVKRSERQEWKINARKAED
jgi:hypothetical protein